MKTKHTKGPWSFKEKSAPDYTYIIRKVESENEGICSIISTENAFADGLLISAAPELLEALQLVVVCSNFEAAKRAYGDSSHWTSIVEKAIKKALNQ